MRLIQTLLVSLALLIAAPTAVQAQDAETAPTLVIHVTSDEAWRGLMGLAFTRTTLNTTLLNRVLNNREGRSTSAKVSMHQ